MGRIPEPDRSLTGEIRKLMERVRRLELKSSFTGTGLSPTADNGTEVVGKLTVTSGEAQSGNFVAGSAGWRLQSNGNAEFNDVTLRGILVGLDTPVQTKTYKVSASSFGLTTPWVAKASASITVPTGCTRASVTMFGRMYVINPNTTGGADGTGTDALYVRVGLSGIYTTATPTGISGSNGFATTNTLDAFDVVSLTPGSSLTLTAEGSSGYQTLAAQTDNYINALATITWLR